MITKAEWKEAAERRLVEKLALMTLLNQIRSITNDVGEHLSPEEAVERIIDRLDVVDEIGK